MYTEHYIPVPGTVYRYVQVLYTAQPCMTARFIIPPNSWICHTEKNWRVTESGPVWGTECALCTQCLPLPSNPPSCQCQNHSISSFRRTIILLYFQNYCQSFTIYSFVTETSRINSPTKLFGAHLAFFKYHLSSLFAFSGTYSLVIFILILLSCLFYYRNVIFSAHASLVAMVTSIITSTNS